MKSLILSHRGCGLAACILFAPMITLADASPSAERGSEHPEPIPFASLGKMASQQVEGDGVSVTADGDGARLRCVLQRLEGEATREGLWLASTVEDGGGDRFQLKAVAVGRPGEGSDPSVEAQPMRPLPSTGQVRVTDGLARFVRPGLVEEYSVSGDGVRQDFVVAERPEGVGDLRVELRLTGARAEPAAYGARLVLEPSGRKLAYGKLHVTDAAGHVLSAHMEVVGNSTEADCDTSVMTRRLTVVVDDGNALYPIRIDPIFTDEDWFSMGGYSGPDSQVQAAALDGAGNLIIGGSFSAVGTVSANRIAKWDGSSWSALGPGVGSGYSAAVYALAASDGDLYAGGSFTNAGGIAVNHIARWDGMEWTALGSGVSGGTYPYVYALAASGSDLYVGGAFTNAGGIAANCIARWAGSSWSPLGSGLSYDSSTPSVRALAVSGSDLYVGGAFRTAGGIPADFVAKWDGATWSALGHGVYGWVYALAVDGSDLYAGGNFKRAGIIWPFRVAKWDGSSWSSLGTGIGSTNDIWSVYSLAVSDGDLYAGGRFAEAGSVAAEGIARWDGSDWYALGAGTPGYVYALTGSNSNLYAGGSFSTMGTSGAQYLARWDGSHWSAMALAGPNDAVWDLEVSGSDLYAGGQFTAVGGEVVNHVARWDGSDWYALGAGIGDDSSVVYALEASGGNLYAGGSFTNAGGVPANHVAAWDGSVWSALDSGVSGGGYPHILTLVVSGSDLYAGGSFTDAGGLPASNIARWDGSAWSALDSGVGGGSAPIVYALETSGSDLYVGGSFTDAGGGPVNGIARWSGNSWSPLGSGFSGGSAAAVALLMYGGNLYAGGSFTNAGSGPANHVAVWDGNDWSALGQGVSGGGYPVVYALEMWGGDLCVGGSFTEAGSRPAANIACWDGKAWWPVGSGTDQYQYIWSLAVSGTNLYVGGSFTMAGGKKSTYLAGVRPGETPMAFAPGSLMVSNGFFEALLTGPEGESAILERTVTYEDWTPIATNPIPPGGWQLSVPAGPEWQVHRARRED